MKKIIVILLLVSALCGVIHATDINMDARFSAGYLRDFYCASGYRYHTDCFSVSMGTDLLAEPVKNIAVRTELGFGANLILGYGKRTYEFEHDPDSEMILYLGLFCGPVVKWHFTDLFSLRLSPGYVALPLGGAIGLDVSAEFAVSEKWSLALDLIGYADLPFALYANVAGVYRL